MSDTRFPLRPVASILCIATLAALSACVPVVRKVIPDITGSITNGGVAVPDAQVLVGQAPDPACGSPKRRVSANARGEFAVHSVHELGVAYPAGEEVTDWDLCVRVGDRVVQGLWFFGHSSKTGIHLQCDLQRKSGEPMDGICVIED